MDEVEPWSTDRADGDDDPQRLRVSDDDRHRVAEQLREAAGEGRIDLTELDQRLEATYAARTYGDLVPITGDLPALAGTVPTRSPVPVSEPAAPGQRHWAVLGRVDRRGVWTVPTRLTVTAVMGGAHLDLRDAVFATREVIVTVNAFMGGADIIVNPRTHVIVEGTGIMGGYSGPSGLVRAELDDDSPTIRIRGVAVWAGVSVKRRRLG